jgi:hypothetical protein
MIELSIAMNADELAFFGDAEDASRSDEKDIGD